MTKPFHQAWVIHLLLLMWVMVSAGGSAFAESAAPKGNNFGEIAQLVELGEAASLVASVTGASPMTFVWRKDGRLVPNAGEATLSLSAVSKESAGTYRLEARNAHGVWNSPAFLLGVYETGNAEVTLVAGKPLRLEPRAWGPGIKYLWSGNGLEETPSHVTPVFQINRMPHGVNSAAVYLMMGESGPEKSGFSYTIKSVGKPVAPTAAQRIRRLTVGQESLDQGYLPTDGIPVTFHAKGLPPGITINATSGDISGAPTRAGDYVAELWTSDGHGSSPPVQQIYLVGSTTIDLFTRSYYGSLYQLPVRAGQVGYLAEIIVSPTGAYTGKLTFKSRVVRLSGRFVSDAAGYVSSLSNVMYGLNLKMTLLPAEGLALEWSDPNQVIEGTFHALWPVYFKSGDPYMDPAGRHVVLLTPEQIAETAAAEVMRGTGFGTLQVNADFSTTFVGTLPDGQGVTCSSHVTVNNRTVPMFLMPLAKRDVLIGDLAVPSRYEVTNPYSIWWYRDAIPKDPISPSGWSRNLVSTVTPYTPPTRGQLLLPFMDEATGNAFISCSSAGRDLEDSTAFIDTLFTLTSAHAAKFVLPNPNGLRIDFYSPTGFFSGQFIVDDPYPGMPLRRVRRTIGFRGMMFPNSDSPHGEGFFLAPPPPGTVPSSIVSGNVWIGPGF
jgi:hypothetical protein